MILENERDNYSMNNVKSEEYQRNEMKWRCGLNKSKPGLKENSLRLTFFDEGWWIVVTD